MGRGGRPESFGETKSWATPFAPRSSSRRNGGRSGARSRSTPRRLWSWGAARRSPRPRAGHLVAAAR
eukprot:5794411-Alexandrium_andersonii.AAC.1